MLTHYASIIYELVNREICCVRLIFKINSVPERGRHPRSLGHAGQLYVAPIASIVQYTHDSLQNEQIFRLLLKISVERIIVSLNQFFAALPLGRAVDDVEKQIQTFNPSASYKPFCSFNQTERVLPLVAFPLWDCSGPLQSSTISEGAIARNAYPRSAVARAIASRPFG